MRKTLLSIIAIMATSGVAMAQNGITILPDAEGLQLQGTAMSPNGRYIGGQTYTTTQAFIYDTQTKKMVAFAKEGEQDTQIKSVSNTGVFVGWNGPACKWEFGTDSIGKETTFGEADKYLYKGISPDGKIIVGAVMDADTWQTQACYFSGDEVKMLPEPSEKFLGYGLMGSSALTVTNDSSIVGYIVDDLSGYPALTWSLNRDGQTFSHNVVSRQLYAGTYDSTKPFTIFSPDQTIASTNGKYMPLQVLKFDQETSEETNGMARYDLETDTIEYFMLTNEEEGDFLSGATMQPIAVSEDGTIIGYYEGGMMEPRKGFIWKVGEQPQLMTKAFPGAADELTTLEYGDNVPCAISADGRYIMGFGYDNTEVNGEGTGANGYVTYLIDTTEAVNPPATGIKSVKPTIKKGVPSVRARYSVNGQQLKSKIKGINLLRMSDGNTVKTLEK